MSLNPIPGALRNARHEAFARALADGKTQLEAMEIAGYTNQRQPKPFASRLANRPAIKQRVANLQLEKANLSRQALVDAKKNAEVDETYVLTRLKVVAERCLQEQPVMGPFGGPLLVQVPKKGADGSETTQLAAVYRFDAMGANKALELIGKHLAMFTDRKVIESGPFSHLSHEQQRQLLDVLENWLQMAEDAKNEAIAAAEKAAARAEHLPSKSTSTC